MSTDEPNEEWFRKNGWQWFGKAYRTHIEQVWPFGPTPVGHTCVWCKEPIHEGDDGFILPLAMDSALDRCVYHRWCFLRSLGIEEKPEDLDKLAAVLEGK